MWGNEETRRGIADGLNAAGITLNGKPARVCGVKNPFATVAQIDGPIHADWAWPTLQNMLRGGAKTLSV